VTYALHPSYKAAKPSPDQLVIVTDSVTLGSFFTISSQKKGFLPDKNPFLPMGREEMPFFRDETQPCASVCKKEEIRTFMFDI